MIESADEVTISIPLNKDLKKELRFCGSNSGRDCDKIKECNLKLKDSRVINTPIIANCEMYYECKVIYKQAMEPRNIIESGEIVDSYLIKGEE